MVEAAGAEGISDGRGEDGTQEAAPKACGPSVRMLVLYIVLPLVLLGGGSAGAYLMGLLDPLLGEPAAHREGAASEDGPSEDAASEDAASEDAVTTASVSYDLPELLVNLNTGSRDSKILKISVALELDDEAAVERLRTVMPRIIDNFQVYLRELGIEDLSGSAGTERLRQELLLRVNAAIRPARVRDVRFKEMLVQ